MADEQSFVKPWRCENGHVLGVVRRKGIDGKDNLYLYRYAIDMNTASDEEIQAVEVMAIINRYAADVQCSVCGKIRSWIRLHGR